MTQLARLLVSEPRPVSIPPAPKSKLPRMLLRPGLNHIPAEQWDAYKAHPVTAKMVERGLIVEEPSPAEARDHAHAPDNLRGLRDLTIEKATPWIQAASDPKQLQKWRRADKRAGIHKLIDEQLEYLEGAEDEDDES